MEVLQNAFELSFGGCQRKTMAMDPAGDANKDTMEVPVGDDVEAIPKWKGEWRMCGSQFCSNCYFVGAPNGCCATDFQVFLCCANELRHCAEQHPHVAPAGDSAPPRQAIDGVSEDLHMDVVVLARR